MLGQSCPKIFCEPLWFAETSPKRTGIPRNVLNSERYRPTVSVAYVSFIRNSRWSSSQTGPAIIWSTIWWSPSASKQHSQRGLSQRRLRYSCQSTSESTIASRSGLVQFVTGLFLDAEGARLRRGSWVRLPHRRPLSGRTTVSRLANNVDPHATTGN